MKKERFVLAFFTGCLMSAVSLQAQTSKGSTKVARSYAINEVVVTGTRSETDVRHLPMTVSVVGRPQLEASQQTSVLPVLNSQVPGFFSTSRGVMGYGVATGASGQMSLRGIGGPAQAGLPTTGLLVLIDGHPQYMGLMGHPIADAYQTMMAERVEVLRGPHPCFMVLTPWVGLLTLLPVRCRKTEYVQTSTLVPGLMEVYRPKLLTA